MSFIKEFSGCLAKRILSLFKRSLILAESWNCSGRPLLLVGHSYLFLWVVKSVHWLNRRFSFFDTRCRNNVRLDLNGNCLLVFESQSAVVLNQDRLASLIGIWSINSHSLTQNTLSLFIFVAGLLSQCSVSSRIQTARVNQVSFEFDCDDFRVTFRLRLLQTSFKFLNLH